MKAILRCDCRTLAYELSSGHHNPAGETYRHSVMLAGASAGVITSKKLRSCLKELFLRGIPGRGLTICGRTSQGDTIQLPLQYHNWTSLFDLCHAGSSRRNSLVSALHKFHRDTASSHSCCVPPSRVYGRLHWHTAMRRSAAMLPCEL